MTNTPAGSPKGEDGDERIHPIQALLDNPFLLLFIGVAMPAVLYTIWGVMELAMIPIAP